MSCNCQNVTVFSGSRPGRYFWLPRLINQSVATKPNCNQHRAREECARDGKVTTTIWWPRSGGEVLAEDVLLSESRGACVVFVALVFFNFIRATSPSQTTSSSVCAAERWERRVYGTRSSRTESITTYRTLPVIR